MPSPYEDGVLDGQKAERERVCRILLTHKGGKIDVELLHKMSTGAPAPTLEEMRLTGLTPAEEGT